MKITQKTTSFCRSIVFILLLISCVAKGGEKGSTKSVNVDFCKELEAFKKANFMVIDPNCSQDCPVGFKSEMYEWYKSNQSKFYSTQCFKTKLEIDKFFGFETGVIPFDKELRQISLIIYESPLKEDYLQISNHFYIDKNDSIRYTY